MKTSFILFITLFSFNLIAQNNLSSDSMKWEILISGNQCLIEYPESLVLKTPEAFQALWNRAFAKMDVPPGRPTVDFEKYHVAAIFSGWKKKKGVTYWILRISSLKKRKWSYTF